MSSRSDQANFSDQIQSKGLEGYPLALLHDRPFFWIHALDTISLVVDPVTWGVDANRWGRGRRLLTVECFEKSSELWASIQACRWKVWYDIVIAFKAKWY